jgi:chorismate mutase
MRIEDRRAELDLIDNELLRLLNRRARLAVETDATAQSNRHSHANAEPGLLERACRVNAGPLDEQAVAKIFRRIIRETVRDKRSRTPLGHWLDEARHEEVGELV